jgi:hypothetical protein
MSVWVYVWLFYLFSSNSTLFPITIILVYTLDLCSHWHGLFRVHLIHVYGYDATTIIWSCVHLTRPVTCDHRTIFKKLFLDALTHSHMRLYPTQLSTGCFPCYDCSRFVLQLESMASLLQDNYHVPIDLWTNIVNRIATWNKLLPIWYNSTLGVLLLKLIFFSTSR